ncbi:MAG: hypothetical protein JWQ69_3779, partial [Pseudomonas sp.]|nr:hypothetical protein [Pseudomonas sp.]
RINNSSRSLRPGLEYDKERWTIRCISLKVGSIIGADLNRALFL